MKKYLVCYKIWENNELGQYVVEATLQTLVDLLEGLINGSIETLYIQFKALEPATPIEQNGAKILLLFLREEINSSIQNTSDELYKEMFLCRK